VGRPALAGDQKGAAAVGATLAFTDETGFLMGPHRRSTLAPRGHTPPLDVRARHRDKASVAAAVCVSPVRRHVRPRWRTYPDGYVDAAAYAEFLRAELIAAVRGPLVLVHDNLRAHGGEWFEDLRDDFPWLGVESLPPYAPELNPVEPLWHLVKDEDLANFCPHDVPELDAAVADKLAASADDQVRLRGLLATCQLPW
jgi:transposase